MCRNWTFNNRKEVKLKPIHLIQKKVLFTFINFVWMTFSLSAQTFYFVAPYGNDNNNATKQGPLKSIEKAQILAQKDKGDVTIFLREGEYRLDKTLIFTVKDVNNKKLTLRSYPGEHVVINGGILLKLKWGPYKKGIVKAKVNPAISIDMLTVNGDVRHMARFPNFNSTAMRFNGTSADATSQERINTWKNPKGGYLHAMHVSDWGDFHYRIVGKDENGNLEFEGGWQNNRKYGLSNDNRMIENIFEELDAPGEWYYDSSTAILYYYPFPNEEIENAKFEVSHLKHLIELKGTEYELVKNISIKNIEFTQTVRTFMEKYEPLLRSDWTIYRGGAILFEGTENCKLEDCYMHNLGGNAIFFSNYNKNSSVSGSHITQIGASAICFVGDSEAVRSPSFEYSDFIPLEQMDHMAGPKTDNYPENCLVYDNLIHAIGMFEKQITGVEISMSKSIRVSHNSIYDVPRAGINISEGTWGGHIIEYNDVFETVKETGDHGSFNSWGRDRFWHPKREEMNRITTNEPSLILADAISTVVIRNNRFRCDRGWDIDLDDGSSNYHIYNNLCLNGGIKLREGFYRVVENNILVNNTFHPHVWFKNSGDVFARNIVMSPYQPIDILDWGSMIDNNILTDETALEEAHKNNTDEHSIVYPVDFQEYKNGNYNIVRDATAIFRQGFHNFDINHFGVVSSKLKLLAETPRMSLPLIIKKNSNYDINTWNNFSVKNMETLGELSATGMGSIRGVYIVTILKFDSSLRDFLQANDVILKLDEIEIFDIADLKKATKQINLEKPIVMVVFRDQRENVIVIPANTIKLED
ncbi:MAG: right-handed parallel beta-helix repeat-containing protein [Melioribacteraceae bacterium]